MKFWPRTNAEKDFDQLQIRSSFYTLILSTFFFVCSILFYNKILITFTKIFQDLTEFGITICLDTRHFLHSTYSHPREFCHFVILCSFSDSIRDGDKIAY